MLPSILFIEENVDVRKPIIDLLTFSGNNVISATSGSEGLELFRNHKFDLVITGSRVPVRDGTTLINELAKLTDFPPVIALSSKSSGEGSDPVIIAQPAYHEKILSLVSLALLTRKLTSSSLAS